MIAPVAIRREEGEDFVLTSGTLTFGPDETALAFTVPIIDDASVELAEWFRATLTAVTAGTAVLGFPDTARVTIHDNDGPTRTFVVKDRVLASGPNWEAEENIPWLTLSQTSGVGPDHGHRHRRARRASRRDVRGHDRHHR